MRRASRLPPYVLLAPSGRYHARSLVGLLTSLAWRRATRLLAGYGWHA